MWFRLKPGAVSRNLSELRKLSETCQVMCVAVIKKVKNVVPLDCRGVIKGFLISVHIVLFIRNYFMVVFVLLDVQH